MGSTTGKRFVLLLVLTFLESGTTMLLERAVHFLSHDHLGFSDTLNLWLAVAYGLTYTAAALLSHRACKRIGERRLLVSVLIAQALVYAVPLLIFNGPVLFAVMIASGVFAGLKWPVVESYMSAGRDPVSTSRAISWFNVSWCSAGPIAMLAAGPIIKAIPDYFFVLPAAVSLLVLPMAWSLQPRPVHLEHDHPLRPPPETVAWYRRLLTASRSTMFCGYALLFVISPLLPGVFERLGVGIILATALAGLPDLIRVITFAFLGFTNRWHGKAWMMWFAIVGIPLSCYGVLSEWSLPVVIGGLVLFGLVGGLTYYASLYYALVVENASVEAGGEHEGLIGAGFFIGPLAGLAGTQLGGKVGSASLGAGIGAAPIIVICTAIAVRALVRRSGPPSRP